MLPSLLFMLTSALLAHTADAANNCALELDKKNNVLVDHVIKLIRDVDYGTCYEECSKHVLCHSINKFLDTDDCELNNATHMSNPDDIKPRNRVNYLLFPERPLYNCSNALCIHGDCHVAKNGIHFYCIKRARDCSDHFKIGHHSNGVYSINPDGQGAFNVYCDMTTDGGGWTVFQRRQDGSVDFFRDWNQYKTGFGNLSGEFWLGNDYLHRLTERSSILRVDLETFAGRKAYAKYGVFIINSAADFYRLNVEDYSGTAGNSLATKHHRNMRFSTEDKDNDALGPEETPCALKWKGGWWYGACYHANLNGVYSWGAQGKRTYKGVTWTTLDNNLGLKYTEMKIRPNEH